MVTSLHVLHSRIKPGNALVLCFDSVCYVCIPGDTGPPGPEGVGGKNGSQGPTGVKGDMGLKGDMGRNLRSY